MGGALHTDTQGEARSELPGAAQPLVTAVITAYNRPDFLTSAIRSVLAQTYPHMEIVIVDDASPTDLRPTVSPFLGERVRYERLETNGGANRARNAGVALARGEYVAFLDDDDEWLADKTMRQLGAIGDREACLGGFGFIGSRKTVVWPGSVVTADDLRVGNPFCGTSGLMARRQALLETPFDETLKNAQDWDVYVRLVQRQPLANAPAPVFNRRYGDHDSITLKARRMTLADIPLRARAVYKHREWLGETHFGRNLAPIILSYFAERPNKLELLSYSVKHAGLPATLWWAWGKATRRGF